MNISVGVEVQHPDMNVSQCPWGFDTRLDDREQVAMIHTDQA